MTLNRLPRSRLRLAGGRCSALLAGTVVALVVSGCESPDNGRLGRIQAAEAEAWAEVLAAERALRAYDGTDLEDAEASYEAELARMAASQVPYAELEAWKARIDSLVAEINYRRTTPLNLDAPTRDSLLIRLRSEYYAARDRWTFTRLAIGFADGK